MKLLRDLRFDRTTELIDELLTLETWLGAQGETLSEELYEIIGAVEDKGVKRHLITLRRSVYQGRTPKGAGFDERVWTVLPTELARRIAFWREQLDRRAVVEAKAKAALEAETAERRRTLRRLASDNSFQQGLLLASRDFFRELTKWLAVGPEAKANRKLEIGLLKYLSRMASKTSPYSTFTSSGEGHWVGGDSMPLRYNQSWARCGVIELNVQITQQIRHALSAQPEVKSHLALRVNSSLLDSGETLLFLGRKGGSEVVAGLAASPTLRQTIQIIQDNEGCSYSRIIQILTEGNPQSRSEEISAFLDKLIDLGLLELDFGIPDQSLDYLGELLKVLEEDSSMKGEQLRKPLLELQAALATYAKAEWASERLERASAINNALEATDRACGSSGRRITIPKKNVFYEDTLVTGANFRCSLQACDHILDDLSILQRLTGLYDVFLPGRLATTSFFTDYYGVGSGVRFLDFYRIFCKETGHPAGWRPNYRVSGSDLLRIFNQPHLFNETGLEKLRELDLLRKELRAQVHNHPVDDKQVRHLNRSTLRSLASKLPEEFVRPAKSVAFYGQMMTRDGVQHLVLNTLGHGFGRIRARVGRLDAKARGRVRQIHRGAYEADLKAVLYADVATVAGSDLNLRVSTVPYEISYPGAVSNRPASEQIPLSDLRVVHDMKSDRLRLISGTFGKEVVPLHLGMMADFFLPPAYRFLVQVFGSESSPYFYLLHGISSFASLDGTETVQRVPRLCLGRVVINRAAWVVKSSSVPAYEKGESPLDYMLKVERWRREHGIAPQCFVRLLDNKTSALDATVLNKARKPIYVDFSSYAFLMVFEQMVRNSDQLVIIEEVLPTDEDLVVNDGKSFYASEFVFELELREEAYA